MTRSAFRIPALVTSFVAVVLLVLTTVSTPTTYHKSTPFDVVRAHSLNGAVDLTSDNQSGLDRARFGLWGYCTEALNSDRFSECTRPLNYMYTAEFSTGKAGKNDSSKTASVKSSYTRGLLTAAVALIASVIAFALSFAPSLIVELVASVVYLIATLITLAAFIVQVVFYVYIRHQLHEVATGSVVYPGPAFYFTLISIPLLFFSALTVCCGYRKGRKDQSLDSVNNKAAVEV
ncbi:uncharacterized protein FA14DRAFT_95740 [Meira miltonrushii]|uniref:Pali-domain-containing protein n=1 Tax=Meira miltonrushii TaxID=1280837 RepID=A0A316V7F1_9BASI|nr:uncharacterized protein FA14DRAFT_95740 [Meira miltonrushii]PWN31405.1 hypothetical protein FA14DRAFT_95740 [Meira miltonrushii]